MRMKLKIAVIEKFGSQIVAARRLKIREARLSYLVQGHADPSPGELAILRKSLGRSVIDSIFAGHSRICGSGPSAPLDAGKSRRALPRPDRTGGRILPPGFKWSPAGHCHPLRQRNQFFSGAAIGAAHHSRSSPTSDLRVWLRRVRLYERKMVAARLPDKSSPRKDHGQGKRRSASA